MRKAINLESFLDVFESNNTELLDSFVKLADNSYQFDKEKGMSLMEINDLAILVRYLLDNLNTNQRNGYFLGYEVNEGIREEFDILRFNEDLVINIELKNEMPPDGIERIKYQLQRHKFLLSILGKKVLEYTFISKTHQLFFLMDNGELSEINIKSLVANITNKYLEVNPLINVKLSDLIISPYSDHERFREHTYFLSDEQHRIKCEILCSPKDKIGLIGGPGTGKSMLLFDLASEYVKLGKRVAIVFCALLKNPSMISKSLEIKIIEIKNLTKEFCNDYDVILVDEAHRIWEEQFNLLRSIENKLIIFALDNRQVLHYSEQTRDIQNKLEIDPDVEIKKLKYKVRTNQEMASFIRRFLDLKVRNVQYYNYDKVHVVYFNNNEKAKSYINNMHINNDFTVIELSEYRTKQTGSLKRKKICNNSEYTHSIIGQEFDKVLVPLDKYFKYSEEGKLISDYNEYYPYDENRCVFQALTRVKDYLLLVVVDNPNLYKSIQKILTRTTEKLMKNGD